MKEGLTTEELMEKAIETVEKMSSKEKALLRIQLRKDFKLPPVPEPEAFEN